MSSKLTISASAADCWSRCTAQPHYVQANASRIPPQDTEFSVEGTQAHSVLEALFKGAALPDYATPEMVRHAKWFRNYCAQFESDWSYSEMKVSLFYMPERNGYIDWCSFSPEVIDIGDFKYGQGVAVNAEENLQMSIYARSTIHQLKIPATADTKVRMHIGQPRVRKGDKLSMWEISYAELVQFTDDRVVGPSLSILDKEGVRTFAPGEKQCRFCPAKNFCGMEGYEPTFPYQGQMRAQWLVGGTPLEPLITGQKPELPALEAMSPEALTKVITFGDEIVKWLNGAKKYGAQLAQAGTPLPGTKVVLSKGGHRTWSDPDEARIMFSELEAAGKLAREQFIKETLITPKQAEEFEFDFEQENWNTLQSLIFKPPGKPVLAALDDPRPAYTGQMSADVFDEEDEV